VNYSKWTRTYSKQAGIADVSFDLGIGLAGKLACASIPISFSQKNSREENEQSISYYPENGQYPKTAGMAILKSKGVYLDKNNDYFTLNATISTIDTGLTQNYQSLAKFLWTFDIYYYGQMSGIFKRFWATALLFIKLQRLIYCVEKRLSDSSTFPQLLLF